MGFILTKWKKKIEDIHCKIVADHANMPVSFYVRFFFVFDDLLICRHHIINSEWCVVLASGHSCQFVLLKNAWSLSPVCALVLRWHAGWHVQWCDSSSGRQVYHLLEQNLYPCNWHDRCLSVVGLAELHVPYSMCWCGIGITLFSVALLYLSCFRK